MQNIQYFSNDYLGRGQSICMKLALLTGAFMQKHGANVPNKIMSSNNDFFFISTILTHNCHTLVLRFIQCMYYDSSQFKSRFI